MVPKSKKCIPKGGGPERYSDRLTAGMIASVPETHLGKSKGLSDDLALIADVGLGG